MGSTTAHIFVYKNSSGGFDSSRHLMGSIWLQQGDRPSWNIKTEQGQKYWPCSKIETIYAEGVTMAAIFFSGNEQIEKLTEKIYGDSLGMGVRIENYEYLKLLAAIKNISREFEFVIFSHLEIPPDRLDGIKKLGVAVKIATLDTVEDYVQKHRQKFE